MAGKRELAARLRARNPELFRSTKDAERVLERVLLAIQEASGEGVRLPGFGSFTMRQRPARKGMNPRTGEPMRIPAREQVVFKPARGEKRYGYGYRRSENPWSRASGERRSSIDHLVRTIKLLRRHVMDDPGREQELSSEIARMTDRLARERPSKEEWDDAQVPYEKPSWAESRGTFAQMVEAEASHRGLIVEQDLWTSIGFGVLQFIWDLLSMPAKAVARKLRLVDEDPEQVKAAVEVIAQDAQEEQR